MKASTLYSTAMAFFPAFCRIFPASDRQISPGCEEWQPRRRPGEHPTQAKRQPETPKGGNQVQS